MIVGDVIVEVCTLFRSMSLRLKRQLVTYLFRQLLRNTASDVGFLKSVGKKLSGYFCTSYADVVLCWQKQLGLSVVSVLSGP